MSDWSCPLCKSHSAKRVFSGVDKMGMTDVAFTVMRCGQCGLFFLIPRPEPRELFALYPQAYEPFRASFEALPWFWRWTYRRHWAIRCRTLRDARPEGGRVLDVGCATGLFLRVLRQQDLWRSVGVDVSENALMVARCQGVDVWRGRAMALGLQDATFDVVTAWEVIEHILDPLALLSEIHRVLRSDGTVLLSTPNGQGLQARLWRDGWFGWEVPRHVQIFSPQTLHWALEATGFELTRRLHFPTDRFYFEESFRRWLESRGKVAMACWLPRFVALPIWPISRLVDCTRWASSLVVEARARS